jgi:hypothetical protein
MRSDLFATEQTAADSDITLPGTGILPTNPFKDGREYSFVSEKDGYPCGHCSVLAVPEQYRQFLF